MFTAINSMNRGSLAGAQWQWDGNVLTIQLRGNGKKELVECVKKVELTLSQRFSVPVSIHIEAGQNLAGQDLFAAMQKLRSEMISQGPVSSGMDEKKAVATPSSTDAVYGKPFKGNVIPMQDIDLNMGNVIVEGKVFGIDHKELTKRNAVIIKFDITDNTSSVRVSRFMEKKEAIRSMSVWVSG